MYEQRTFEGKTKVDDDSMKRNNNNSSWQTQNLDSRPFSPSSTFSLHGTQTDGPSTTTSWNTSNNNSSTNILSLSNSSYNTYNSGNNDNSGNDNNSSSGNMRSNDSFNVGNNNNSAFLAALALSSDSGTNSNVNSSANVLSRMSVLPGVLTHVSTYEEYGQEGPEREREKERQKKKEIEREREREKGSGTGIDLYPDLHLHVCTLQSAGNHFISFYCILFFSFSSFFIRNLLC